MRTPADVLSALKRGVIVSAAMSRKPVPAMARWLVLAALILAATFANAQSLPSELSDREFWQLIADFSEADGFFRSDNLLSNEVWFQYVIPELTRTAKTERVYLGVGPEQNFTYMAALKPKMAFIFDIRRGNMHVHLVYKALFELSPDRADFVSRMFARKRPEGIGPQSTAGQIFDAIAKAAPSESLYSANLRAILDNLKTTHGLPLSADDVRGIDYVYRAFTRFGPDINYSSSTGGFGGNRVTYAELMTATDEMGNSRSYLANEENFAFLKDLEKKNLVVPLVGNFAGPKAIGAVGQYLKDKKAMVSAFYLSNVEQFLRQDDIWNTFCGNASALPLDETSVFVRSIRGGRFGNGVGLNSDFGNMLEDLKECAVSSR